MRTNTSLLLLLLALTLGCTGASAASQPPGPTALFCPQDDCETALLRQMGAAKSSIHCAIYVVTLEDVADALVAAKERGIDVKIVTEKDESKSEWSQYPKLKGRIDVRLDGNFYTMHNKYCIFDGRIVWTGSFNWSKNANERNNENVLVLEDEKIAGEYEQDFERIYGLTG